MEERYQRACELIWRLWQSGEVIDELPDDLRPQLRRERYAIQAGLERCSAKPRAGWKIAATSLAGQKHINVDGPIAGRLLAEKMIADGGRASIAANRMRVAEPEFAFQMARPLGPRAVPYSVDDVMTAVGDLYLCIELPDSRFRDFTAVGGPSLIADNACARELVIGPRVTADWRALDLAAHAVRATVGTRYTRDGVGRNVLGDPRIGLTWLVNEVTALGLTLGAGELVTTGTCVVPLEIEAGDYVEADFGLLGRVGVSIAP